MRAEQLHQKLGLVQQLKTLARQHEQILQAYERKVQEKLQEGSLAVAAGGKRAGPPLVAEGPEAKRHRQLAERASRKNELWNEVVKIVEKIRKNTKSEPFRQPVDPIKLKIPDYLNVISKPMDLGTVLKKLRSKPLGYTQPQEVAEDVRQIWTNCRTYNGLNHPVSQAANTCSEAFEKSWGQANIEQRWEVEMMREQREEQVGCWAGWEQQGWDLSGTCCSDKTVNVSVTFLCGCCYGLCASCASAAHYASLSIKLADFPTRVSGSPTLNARTNQGPTLWFIVSLHTLQPAAGSPSASQIPPPPHTHMPFFFLIIWGV
jgi:hypothetical protein